MVWLSSRQQQGREERERERDRQTERGRERTTEGGRGEASVVGIDQCGCHLDSNRDREVDKDEGSGGIEGSAG